MHHLAQSRSHGQACVLDSITEFVFASPTLAAPRLESSASSSAGPIAPESLREVEAARIAAAATASERRSRARSAPAKRTALDSATAPPNRSAPPTLAPPTPITQFPGSFCVAGRQMGGGKMRSRVVVCVLLLEHAKSTAPEAFPCLSLEQVESTVLEHVQSALLPQ